MAKNMNMSYDMFLTELSYHLPEGLQWTLLNGELYQISLTMQ
jgi:hypothetical protein